MSRARRETRALRERHNLRNAVERSQQLMAHAAHVVDTQNLNIAALQKRNDVWRNLLTGCAFAAGLGNERPLSEVIRETHPELFSL